ncbi:hypothetical protein V6N13_128943 [Hibiscus sabdariffa]
MAPRSGMYKFCFRNPYDTPETVSFHIPNEHDLSKDVNESTRKRVIGYTMGEYVVLSLVSIIVAGLELAATDHFLAKSTLYLSGTVLVLPCQLPTSSNEHYMSFGIPVRTRVIAFRDFTAHHKLDKKGCECH